MSKAVKIAHGSIRIAKPARLDAAVGGMPVEALLLADRSERSWLPEPCDDDLVAVFPKKASKQ